MSKSLTRRSALLSLSCLSLGAVASAEDAVSPMPKGGKPDKGPALEADLVRRFVGAAHGKLDEVKAMLADRPSLINATWDWGGGDFETGLGGASHMGRRDIAEYLLEHNARMDLFAATMLGKLEIVKAAVAAFPGIVNVPGPHGIPLLVHAEKGGEEARSVLEYLQGVMKQ